MLGPLRPSRPFVVPTHASPPVPAIFGGGAGTVKGLSAASACIHTPILASPPGCATIGAMSTALQQPGHWSRPTLEPLNTKPLSPLTGASYVVGFDTRGGNGRRITANQNSTGKAGFIVPWPDASTFETDSLGYSEFVYGQKYLNRRTPMLHGDPAQGSLYLDTLETVGFSNFSKNYHESCTVSDGAFSAKWPKTELIYYAATFSQRPYLILEDSAVSSAEVPELKRYVTRFSETEAYHRKIPGYGFAFEGSPSVACTTLASLPEFCLRFIYTTYFWPFPDSIPEDYIARTLGTVNSNDFFDPDVQLTEDDGTRVNGFRKQTLKYEDCRKSQPYFGSDDLLYCDLQHIFLWNPRNWQKQLDPTSKTYKYIKQRDSTGAFYSPDRFTYEERDFNKIFKPRGST